MHTHGLLLLGGVEPNVVYEGRNRVVLAGALVGRNRVVLPHTLALSFSHRKTFRNRPLQPLRAALQPRWPKQRQACVLKADISACRRRHSCGLRSLIYGYFIYFMEQQ